MSGGLTSALVAYLAIAGLLVITPGPDMALVTKNALTRGSRAALATAFGIEAGLLVWTGASVLGIAALLRASATAFTVVKLAGAAYLVYLGVTAFLSLRPTKEEKPVAPGPRIVITQGSPFRQGLLSNVFNPKIAVFFTSLIPQFVTPGPSATAESVLLAGIFIGMGLVWLTSYAFIASTASAVLRRPAITKALAVLTGCVLIGFGLRLALARP
jgi:threonine/homoserine/homoserine lactone efflux protein